MSLVSHRCLSVMSSISVFERVKFALNSNDEITLRAIYNDLACRLRSLRVISSEEHLKEIRGSSSFLSRNIGAELFVPQHAKEGRSCIAVR